MLIMARNTTLSTSGTIDVPRTLSLSMSLGLKQVNIVSHSLADCQIFVSYTRGGGAQSETPGTGSGSDNRADLFWHLSADKPFYSLATPDFCPIYIIVCMTGEL